MLLRFTGRKTGRSYTTPVSYVLDGNSLLVPAGGAWWRNLEARPRTSVRLRGAWRSVTSEVIREPALADLLLGMIQKNPAIGVLTGIRLSSDGRLDTSALERERRRGFVVVRLRLDEDPRQARTAAA
jgi:deazaflavin-dependent oxidoreductase (nitroreductase family)